MNQFRLTSSDSTYVRFDISDTSTKATLAIKWISDLDAVPDYRDLAEAEITATGWSHTSKKIRLQVGEGTAFMSWYWLKKGNEDRQILHFIGTSGRKGIIDVAINFDPEVADLMKIFFTGVIGNLFIDGRRLFHPLQGVQQL